MPEMPMLFVEFHGSEAGVAEQAARFGEIAESVGGGPFEWAGAEEERQRLWQARHNAYWAALALKPGCTAMSTDVCVPISRLAECVEATQADLAASGIVAPIVGHVGDGNFHVLPLMNPDDTVERDRVAAFSHRLVERALAMEVTCTGEHGIGQGKRKYLAAEHGEGVLAVMRALKAAIDPLGIMNPGKVAG
jgi:D-lactate dehydrogenase (cytochrome)